MIMGLISVKGEISGPLSVGDVLVAVSIGLIYVTAIFAMDAGRDRPGPNNVHRYVKSLAPIVVVLLLAGCTTEAPERSRRQAASRVDPDDPCDLLTPQQVEDAIGTEVRGEREVASHNPAIRICSYETTEPWASVGVSLEANVNSQDFDDEIRRDPPNTEPVDDVGDGAFIHACASVTVHVSQTLVTAAIQHFTTCDETRVVLTNLGRVIESSARTAGAP